MSVAETWCLSILRKCNRCFELIFSYAHALSLESVGNTGQDVSLLKMDLLTQPLGSVDFDVNILQVFRIFSVEPLESLTFAEEN